MFKTQNLNVHLQNKTLLRHLDLSISTGKITGILGANGAGKSTLFKALLGEIGNPDEVYFSDTSLANWQAKELSKCRAYVAQGTKPSFGIQVFEYLMLARDNYEETENTSLALLADLAELTGIVPLLSRCMTHLSGGEFQLVEFTRAWLQLIDRDSMEGKCLLLDEPASALDIKQRQKLYRLIKAFQLKGGTAVLIDHDINAVASIAQDLVMMRDGSIIVKGESHSIFNETNLNKCFDVCGRVLTNEHGNNVYLTD